MTRERRDGVQLLGMTARALRRRPALEDEVVRTVTVAASNTSSVQRILSSGLLVAARAGGRRRRSGTASVTRGMNIVAGGAAIGRRRVIAMHFLVTRDASTLRRADGGVWGVTALAVGVRGRLARAHRRHVLVALLTADHARAGEVMIGVAGRAVFVAAEEREGGAHPGLFFGVTTLTTLGRRKPGLMHIVTAKAARSLALFGGAVPGGALLVTTEATLGGRGGIFVRTVAGVARLLDMEADGRGCRLLTDMTSLTIVPRMRVHVAEIMASHATWSVLALERSMEMIDGGERLRFVPFVAFRAGPGTNLLLDLLIHSLLVTIDAAQLGTEMGSMPLRLARLTELGRHVDRWARGSAFLAELQGPLQDTEAEGPDQHQREQDPQADAVLFALFVQGPPGVWHMRQGISSRSSLLLKLGP